MRVQVSMGKETVKKVDELAKEIGVSRSALCSMMIFKSLPMMSDWKEREMFNAWITEGENMENIEENIDELGRK